MSFFQRLEARARQMNSLLCVGLDPHLNDLESPSLEGVRSFCLRLIQGTADLAVAFKPNIAFFELFGSAGLKVLEDVMGAIPEGIPVILDAKRGDIASTAEAYAQAVFNQIGATAVTVNPYLGYDSVGPFIKDPEKGVFLLCKTSNPGSADLQDLPLSGGDFVYEQVASLAQKWNEKDNIGVVVGATQPEALHRIRVLAPELWFLAPGVGVQGGDLHTALQAGMRADGMGMLISVSRSISRASDPHRAAEDIVEAIRIEQKLLRKDHMSGHFSKDKRLKSSLMDGLLDAGCVKFGQFTLKSGLQSPIYLDLRQLVSFPHLLTQVATAYLPILRNLKFDRLAALPYAAIPIGAAISLQGNWPMIYPRKEAKTYGTKADIEGIYKPGEIAVVIDDLATTGSSKFKAVEKLTQAGLKISDVVVLIDRQSGAKEALDQAGMKLHAAFELTEMLDYWEASEKVSREQGQAVREFLRKVKES
jgi:uridine monophosphate synthetase